MLTTLLSKLGLPALVLMAGVVAGIFLQQRVLDKPVHITCPKAPDCHCPEAQGIDFEKIKGFKGNINVHQHYTMEVNGDSTLITKVIEQALHEAKNERRRK